MNVVAAFMSLILALTLLAPIPQLCYYLVSTAIIAATLFKIRTHLLTRSQSKTPEPPQGDLLGTEKDTRQLKRLLLIFVISVLLFALPLLLARFLDPYVWFILLMSCITGVSAAEILFYFYTR